ncbi:hypothetical protein [Lysinibacter cavernae]|uniref:hypothetical protein n=1 Tax=Lysinibacter cavernae TaxID=1640652 RepID=UPI00360BBA50
MANNSELHDELRSWAQGMTTLQAATELLIQAGFVSHDSEWVKQEPEGRSWIDFQAIPDLIGGKSGGEQRLLRIAASIGDGAQISLGDELTGLDYSSAELVLAAMLEATGFSKDSETIGIVDGKLTRGINPGLRLTVND